MVLPITPRLFWVVVALTALVLFTALLSALPSGGQRASRSPLERLQRALGMAGLNSAVFLFLLLIWAVLLLLPSYEFFLALLDPSENAENIRNIGLALAAIIGVPFLVWRSAVAAKQAQVAEQSHITDQINAAVLGLGSEKTRIVTDDEGNRREQSLPNLEVRIGAILSLERIAQRSDDDHVRIMEVLCAYIRENTKERNEAAPPTPGFPERNHEAYPEPDYAQIAENYRDSMAQWALSLSPRNDVQIALRVIGRRSHRQRQIEITYTALNQPSGASSSEPPSPEPPTATASFAEWNEFFLKAQSKSVSYSGYRIDLHGTDLRGYDLLGMNFEKADFRKANLSAAVLTQVDFSDALFFESHLNAADMREARLDGADLFRANLCGANLTRARARGANFSSAWIRGAVCSSAKFKGSSFKNATMQACDLTDVRLNGSNLRQSRMQGTDFWNTRLKVAHMKGAWLQNATLRETRLQQTNMIRCRLQNAKVDVARLEDTNLQRSYLQGACLRRIELSPNSSLELAELRGAGFFGVTCDIEITESQLHEMFGDWTTSLPNGLNLLNQFESEATDWRAFNAAWRAFQAEIGFDPDDPSTW